MDHAISYDMARGLHVISVIAWVAGLLMLPRFYASITATSQGDAAERELLQSARTIRLLILTPFLVLSWAFGLFLLVTYFAPDWEAPLDRVMAIPTWFWAKFGLALALTGYHGLLVSEGHHLARGQRRRSETYWRILSIVPFLVAAAIVLLATIEP